MPETEEEKKERRNRSRKKYYEAHKEEERAKAMEYHNAHKDEINAKVRERRRLHPEKMQKYRDEHKAEHYLATKASREKNPLLYRELGRVEMVERAVRHQQETQSVLGCYFEYLDDCGGPATHTLLKDGTMECETNGQTFQSISAEKRDELMLSGRMFRVCHRHNAMFHFLRINNKGLDFDQIVDLIERRTAERRGA